MCIIKDLLDYKFVNVWGEKNEACIMEQKTDTVVGWYDWCRNVMYLCPDAGKLTALEISKYRQPFIYDRFIKRGRNNAQTTEKNCLQVAGYQRENS